METQECCRRGMVAEELVGKVRSVGIMFLARDCGIVTSSESSSGQGLGCKPWQKHVSLTPLAAVGPGGRWMSGAEENSELGGGGRAGREGF